ncbi:MAG: single-stranded DNA-binding protein [Spirochaetales bacterium]|nr:single-stranded DNA-binding protein [Spirochaetales bacterium]
MNQVVLVGRLTRDAELRYTSAGMAICSLSLAVNRRVKKDDQWLEEPNYFDLTLWGKQAEGVSKYLVKGTQIAVDGELRQDRWEKDGQKHSKVQVSINNLQLLGGNRQAGASAPSSGPSEVRSPASSPNRPVDQRPSAEFDPQSYEDDIPF